MADERQMSNPTSIMTMLFGGALQEEAFTDTGMLEFLEQAGFAGVELDHRRFDGRPEILDTYIRYLADSPLEVVCLDGIADLALPEGPARQKEIDALRRAIESAHRLSCPCLLAAGSRLPEGLAPEQARGQIAEALRSCMPEADQAGVTLCIENFGIEPRLQCAAADCIEVIEAVPGLQFAFDTGNFYFAGESADQNLALLQEKICHVHIKDWVKSDAPDIADLAGTPLGAGIIPNPKIIRDLLANGYTGAFSLELTAHGALMQTVPADLAALKLWLDSEGAPC